MKATIASDAALERSPAVPPMPSSVPDVSSAGVTASTGAFVTLLQMLVGSKGSMIDAAIDAPAKANPVTPHDGSITGLYTVLVEADDMNDPIGDTARAILDGHIVLSRDLATANHFPAVDVLASVSRLADTLATPEQATAAAAVRDCLATYHDARDLITIGA